MTPHVKLAGPTSFAPLIYKTIELVCVQPRPVMHILVIICDGAITNDGPTIQAICEASNYPIAIICVGVGDGPWHTMQKFDDRYLLQTIHCLLDVVGVAIAAVTCCLNTLWLGMPAVCLNYNLRVPERQFDNFQFVEYSNMDGVSHDKQEALFALSCVEEVPDQVKHAPSTLECCCVFIIWLYDL